MASGGGKKKELEMATLNADAILPYYLRLLLYSDLTHRIQSHSVYEPREAHESIGSEIKPSSTGSKRQTPTARPWIGSRVSTAEQRKLVGWKGKKGNDTFIPFLSQT